MVNSRSYGLIIIVFAVVMLEPVSCWLWDKTHVYITNEFRSKKVLKLHCKSKDDDLGSKRIRYGQTYHFSFGATPLTRFDCRFGWEQTPRHWVFRNCVIYQTFGNSCKSSRGYSFDNSAQQCKWRIDENGMHHMADGIWRTMCSW